MLIDKLKSIPDEKWLKCVGPGRLHACKNSEQQKVQFAKCLKTANCTQLFAKSHRDKTVWTNFDRQDKYSFAKLNNKQF